MPALAIRVKIESSIKFLRGIVVASTGELIESANVEANTDIDTREVSSDRIVCRRSALIRYSSGFLRKLQSVVAADTKRPDATITIKTLNHLVPICLASLSGANAVIHQRHRQANSGLTSHG